MLPFVIGSTCVVVPQVGLPLLALSAAGQGVKALRDKVRGNKTVPASQGVNNIQGSTNTSSAAKLAGVISPTGHVAPVTLRWSGITCTLHSKKKGSKKLLSNMSGVARPGRLLAVMGPSGSGKTTLLHTLAGSLAKSKNLQLTGSLTVNGVPASESNHRQAFVQQQDILYSQLTARETLSMAAELRLPPSMSSAAKREYVDQLLSLLGLAKVADTPVGDKKRRGLSGGEMKRLSLGQELMGSPSLVFLDEPTSGLDAAAALKVMSTLHALAQSGHTVVVSIHQPRSSIWSLFDDLLLLSEGEVVYAGPASKALDHFSALGHTCPPQTNPAEFLADLVGGEAENGDEQDGAARARALAAAWRDNGLQSREASSAGNNGAGAGSDVSVGEGGGEPLKPRLPWWRQFKLLASRSWKQVIRDKSGTISRATANVFSGLLFGMIWFRMGRTQSSIQDRLGLLQVVTINSVMSSLSKTLNVFPKERVIVNRERAHHVYGMATYLGAKLLAELPYSAIFPALFGTLVYPLCGLNQNAARFAKFLGLVTLESFASSAFGLMVSAFAPTTEAAMAIGPAAMTLFIVFGGLYVNSNNVPAFLRWLPKVSLIKQGFEGLVINEFKGSSFELDASGQGYRDGQQVLRWLAFDKSSAARCGLTLARITAFFYVSAYSILLANKPRSQPLEAPALPEANTDKTSASDKAAIKEAEAQAAVPK